MKHPFKLGEIYKGKKIVLTFYRAPTPGEPKEAWIRLEDGSEVQVTGNETNAPQG